MSMNHLLEPGNHALLLIDHKYLQVLTLRSHEASQVINACPFVRKSQSVRAGLADVIQLWASMPYSPACRPRS
jgi:hypothetical protein